MLTYGNQYSKWGVGSGYINYQHQNTTLRVDNNQMGEIIMKGYVIAKIMPDALRVLGVALSLDKANEHALSECKKWNQPFDHHINSQGEFKSYCWDYHESINVQTHDIIE